MNVQELFNSFSSSDPISKHKQWLDCIRTVWEDIEFEDELPQWEALWRHWLHSCWVSHFGNKHTPPFRCEFGWKVVDDCLEID